MKYNTNYINLLISVSVTFSLDLTFPTTTFQFIRITYTDYGKFFLIHKQLQTDKHNESKRQRWKRNATLDFSYQQMESGKITQIQTSA